MHINIIAHEFAPYIVNSPLSEDIVNLARTIKKSGHTASVLVPFKSDIDVTAHALARRLMPVKATVGEGVLSCHRYDSRSPDGINLYFLDIERAPEKPEGVSANELFYAAICSVMTTFTEAVDGCIALGTETAGFAAVLDQNEALNHIPVVSVLSTLTEQTDESAVRELESTDRIVLSHGRLYAGSLCERLSPLKEKLSKGHIHWISRPVVPPALPPDKPSAKTAFQMSTGLPVRNDTPLVLFFESAASNIADFLAKDVQVAILDTMKEDAALIDRYGDRLVQVKKTALVSALDGADGALIGDDRGLMATALAHGAVPIVTKALSDEAVDLESTLESGAAIVIEDLSSPHVAAGLERLFNAFHVGADFERLLSRIPEFANTWEKVAYQLIELIKEISSEKRKDEQTE